MNGITSKPFIFESSQKTFKFDAFVAKDSLDDRHISLNDLEGG